MRLAMLPLLLMISACGQAATDFGFNDFYLNCEDSSGNTREIFYVDEGRRQVSRLEEDGQLYLVCGVDCENIHSDTTLKWTTTYADGSWKTTNIDRLSGKLQTYGGNPNAAPIDMGGVAVPADLLGQVTVLNCTPSDSPPAPKF